ncbi:uncharacterized protein F13E9.13, mitochondrial-like [Branchiostoma lanceolatum]|uniref:uncharacterized protein F13E9.13, mitochondrial-like n=1 Tax=Branchiostoma lanceolatum TaxID=7740 RepID=UPI003453FF19
MQRFQKVFGRLQAAAIGMVHVGALPGTPRSSATVGQLIDKACQEAEIYKRAGLDAVMVENMHDVPYLLGGDVGPEVTATMTAVCREVRRVCPRVPCGVQVLSAANKQALAVALAAGLDFVRVEGFVFSHVADEGFLNSCAGDLLRYRTMIGADSIMVFTDIKKKHSSHAITADVSIADTARAAEFFLSDGVIVTGTETGRPVDSKELKEVQQAVDIPVLVGSGVSTENLPTYLRANGLIVGSYFKKNGRWQNEVDLDRVDRFMDRLSTLRQKLR